MEGYVVSRHQYDAFTKIGGETRQLMSDPKEWSETPVYGLFKTPGGVNDLCLIGRNGTMATWK
jgi:hypothetical protein